VSIYICDDFWSRHICWPESRTAEASSHAICGPSLAVTAGSSPARGMNVCLLECFVTPGSSKSDGPIPRPE